MSGSKQAIVVSRSYSPAPDYCARAMELLLKKPVKKGGPAMTAPDDAAKEIQNGCDATRKYRSP